MEKDFWSLDEWGDHDDGTEPPGDLFPEGDGGEPSLEEVVRALGRETELDFVVNLNDVEDASLIRATRFSTLEDAIYFIYEIGVGGFSDVVRLEFNLYGVVIPEHTPEVS